MPPYLRMKYNHLKMEDILLTGWNVDFSAQDFVNSTISVRWQHQRRPFSSSRAFFLIVSVTVVCKGLSSQFKNELIVKHLIPLPTSRILLKQDEALHLSGVLYFLQIAWETKPLDGMAFYLLCLIVTPFSLMTQKKSFAKAKVIRLRGEWRKTFYKKNKDNKRRKYFVTLLPEL